jgi:cyclopropane-fatty-acyl-phospholipid synthase
MSRVLQNELSSTDITLDKRELETLPGPRSTARADAVRKRTREILEDLFGTPAERSFAIRYWDGSTDQPGVASPPFTIVLNHPASLAGMLLPPSQLRLAESFIRGDFEIEGDLEAAAGLADQLRNRFASPVAAARLMLRLRRLPRRPSSRWGPNPRSGVPHGSRHSIRRDAAAVRFHYDLGNEFYALWLDRQMVYSCAYFVDQNDDIDTAQAAKLDYVCRKLRLVPGERLLDIGCGWGALIRFAVEHYGVHAVGITLSEAQASLANQIIADRGLSERCRVEVRDYRELIQEPTFNKLVSVGMVEHVGREQLDTYFRIAFQVLRPGGLFLNHGITWIGELNRGDTGRWAPRWNWREGEFMNRHVFPDGDLLPLARVIAVAEAAGFETRDVENLREHYTLTLRNWLRGLERSAAQAIGLVGERTYRTWRLYLAACASRFASGRMAVNQVLLAKPDPTGAISLPLTRADLYPTRVRS